MTKHLHDMIVYSDKFGQINSPTFYDSVVHLICTEGSGSFLYNDRRFTVSENDIAVISLPRLVTDIQCDKNFRCQYITAPEQFIHNLLPANNYSIQGRVSLFDNPIIKVSRTDASRFIADLDNIRQRIGSTDHSFYQELMGSLLQTMVYDLFDFHAKSNENILTTDRVGYITTRFFAMIKNGLPRTRRDVAYYAGELHVTTKYLSDVIKRVTGFSASAHIHCAATAIALAFIKDSSMSISQIAEEMNFSSLSYFSRYCVKHAGLPPGKFRTAGVNKESVSR